MYRLLPALLLTLLLSPLAAQEPASIGDESAIDWFYPGHFDEALKAAEERDRLLLVKCVFFGVDEEGATCATKGLW